MNKKKRITVCAVAVMLLLSIIVGIVVALIPQSEQSIPETSESIKGTDTSTETEKDTQDPESEDNGAANEETVNRDDYVFDDGRETAVATPIITFDEGNEIYMDMDVAARLEAMEKTEGDKRVNKILDTIIQLINKFAAQGYSSKAIKQIQRFYFVCYEQLQSYDFDTVRSKIESLISKNGADSTDFANRAQELFGIAPSTDYSYIFEVSE